MALFPVKRKNSVQADNTVYCSKATLQKWPTCISWNTQGLNPFRWLVRGLVAGKAPDFLCVWAREPAEAGPSQGKPLGRACCVHGPAQASAYRRAPGSAPPPHCAQGWPFHSAFVPAATCLLAMAMFLQKNRQWRYEKNLRQDVRWYDWGSFHNLNSSARSQSNAAI